MLPHRTTMKDVARAAGVHQTTVSLALRNSPSLPKATRARIKRIARKLGYRPDPVLAALNFYRSSRYAVKTPPVIAFLLNFRDKEELATSFPHLLFLEGASKQAAQLGYKLSVFYIGHSIAESASVEGILRARGITGAILASFTDPSIKFQMNWKHFSAVVIESEQLDLSLHTIANNQQMITREAIQHLRRLGYQRIGLTVGIREEIELKNAFTAGYYVERAQHPGMAYVPPLVLPSTNTPEIGPQVAHWVREHRIDAVMSNWSSIPDALRREGLRIPRDVVVATLDFDPDNGAGIGIRQNHRTVGERAVEQLAILMKMGQRGLIDKPNMTLIDGQWVDGPWVPSHKHLTRNRSSMPAVK